MRAISHNARFSTYVRPIQAADAADAEVIAAVSKVLDFVQDGGTIGYYVPEILHNVDPEGLVVPGAVADKAHLGFMLGEDCVPWLEERDGNELWPAHVRATVADLARRLGHGV